MASSEDDREPSSVLAERPAATEGARLAAIAALFGPFTAGARKKGGGGSDTASRPGHEHGRPGADGFTGGGSDLTSAACPGGAPPHHETRSRWWETATRRPLPKAGSRLVP
jgi:hypothetical protein